MSKLRVHCFSMSIDGFAAGPHQSLDDPLGVGGQRLHEWVFASPSGRRMFGEDVAADEPDGIDDDFFARGVTNIGATIMGRNMFGPVRGAWPDLSWTGWWGDEPPYHHDVFVLTHHARPPLSMQGGTTFHFTADPIDLVLARAVEAADGADVRLGGGVSTVQQYLRAGLVDELHVAIAPTLLGEGERLFEGVSAAIAGYECTEFVSSALATHAVLTRRTS